MIRIRCICIQCLLLLVALVSFTNCRKSNSKMNQDGIPVIKHLDFKDSSKNYVISHKEKYKIGFEANKTHSVRVISDMVIGRKYFCC